MKQLFDWAVAGASGVLLIISMAGCQTAGPEFMDVRERSPGQSAKTSAAPDSLLLHEGDVVRISFPGAPNLNTVQQIRRDGKIALPLVGEFKAAGLGPRELEQALLEKYAPQLVTKEVSVAVESSAYPVYVTGAVQRSGKLVYDRPVTALEAVMEAGVDYGKANLKEVKVIRQDKGRVQQYKLNLRGVLQGRQSEQFSLKPSDIIFVPERFSWF